MSPNPRTSYNTPTARKSAARSTHLNRKTPAVLVGMCALCSLLTTPQPAQAQAQDDLRYRVHVQGPIGFYADPNRLSEGRPEPFPTKHLDTAIRRYFQAHSDHFVLIPPNEVYRADPTNAKYTPTATEAIFSFNEAQGILTEGFNNLTRYDLQGAQANFEEVINIYTRLQVPQRKPNQIARVYEYLALVHSEQPNGRKAAVEAFQDMLRFNSRRVIAAPFFPDTVAAMYAEARADLLKRRAQGPDTKDLEHLQALSTLVRADLVVWGYVVQDGQEYNLVLHAYDPNAEQISTPQTIPLTANPQLDRERANRLVSRFAACTDPIPVRPPPGPDREAGHWYLDTSFAYSIYTTRPVEQLFNNYGFALGASYMLSDSFALRTRFNFFTSSVDSDGSLLTSFSSIRAFLGGSFAVRFNRVRPFLHFALEGSRVGEFRHTNTFYCKVNQNDPNQCPAGEIENNAPGWLLGVNSQLGISVRIWREFSAYASVDGSFYFLPLSEKILDVPLGGGFGVEYRF